MARAIRVETDTVRASKVGAERAGRTRHAVLLASTALVAIPLVLSAFGLGGIASAAPMPGQQWWNGSTTTSGGTSVQGGTGTWDVQTATSNWTNSAGSTAAAWAQGSLAIFAGSAGTVTIAGSTVPSVSGMTFHTDGYTLTGGTLTLVGAPITTDTGVTTTIASVIAGNQGIEKLGDGTLILTGVNTYTGGTTVSAGTLKVLDGGQLGSGHANIASNAGMTATLLISGAGSQWALGGRMLNVGNGGNGTLNIESGAVRARAPSPRRGPAR